MRIASILWYIFLIVVILFGIYGIITIKFGVEESPIPWNILIVTYVYLAIMSTGLCVISVAGNVYKLRGYKVIAERAAFLAIITMLCAYIPLFTHIGHISRMYEFLTSPNLYSSMWWMGVLYALYLLFETIEFWFLIRYNVVKLSMESSGIKKAIYKIISLGSTDISEKSLKRDARLARVIGFVALFAALSAHFTLATIFARVEAKALWYGAFMPLHFILSAIRFGIATILLTTILSYWITRREILPELKEFFSTHLRQLFAFLIAFSLIYYLWLISQSPLHKETYFFWSLLLIGPYARDFWLFQIIIGKVIPLIILLLPIGRTINGLFTASVLFIVGNFVLRFQWIIVGQVLPLMNFRGELIEYTPTTPELLVVSGTFAAIALIYTIGVKLLPLERWYIIAKS